MTKNEDKIIKILLFLAFFFRLIRLGNQSLYADEGFTWFLASFPIKEIPQMIVKTCEVHPPFYFYFLHIWIWLFGNSEFAMRLPSVIFGTASIYTAYILVKKTVNCEVAVWTAFFMSFSGFFIQYNQEVRMYSLLVLLCLASFYWFWKILDEGVSLKGGILYIIFTVLAFYTHYFGFWLILIEFVFLLCFLKKFGKKFLQVVILQGFTFILFLPWLKIFLHQKGAQDFSLRLAPTVKGFLAVIFNLGFSENLRFVNPQFFLNIIELPVFLCSLLSLILLLNAVFHCKKSGELFYGFYFFLPCIAIILISKFTKYNIFEWKYFLVFLPAYFVLWGMSLHSMKSNFVKFLIVALFLIFNFQGYCNKTFNMAFQNQDWRVATGLINLYAENNDVVLVYPSLMHAAFIYYYKSRASAYPVEFDVKKEQLLDMLKGKQFLWFLFTPNHPACQKFEIEQILNNNLKIKRVFVSHSQIRSNVLELILYKIPKGF